MQKTVLITGCSSGFGRTTAHHFAQQGWNVVATMRDTQAAGALATLANVLVTRLDVQDGASIAAAIAAGIARFGAIDALVNNAGFGLFGLFEATTPEQVREQFDVNVFGAMEVTRAILPHFRSRHAGLILNVTSGAGVFGLPMISLYCASKFALEGFSEALSYELAGVGVTVKLIEPGGVLSTNFSSRSAQEGGRGSALPDYDRFVAGALQTFAGLRADRLATEEDVAKVIFKAATDGLPQLRYVATEDIRPLVDARRGSSEEEYMALMRARFSGATTAR
jgi:NAD(P)-dependent dehydrogenase (short-subunit alcohol dehydrogenase family)